MPNDPQWLMSALAAQDAYRDDGPAWPDAPMGAVANPWADYMSRDQPLPTHAPERPLTRGEFVAGALGAMPGNILKSTFGAASAKLKPNPYPPGSEEAQDYEDRLRAQSYEFGPEVAQMMVGTGSFAGPKSMLGTGGSNIVQPIRAYHSSPHDFEKFDASKIGTGQGAASYGVGHYLAENPKVSGRGGEYWDEFARRFVDQPTPEGMATRALVETKADRAAAIAKLSDPSYQNFLKDFLPQSRFKDVDAREALKLLESGKPVGPRTYEVDIHARPEQFLDWDRPLSGQSPPVRDFLREQSLAVPSDAPGPRRAGKHIAAYQVERDAPGSDVYRALSQSLVKPEDLRPGFEARSPLMASEALREAGIPGIRYLDQGSRFQQALLNDNPMANEARKFIEAAGGNSQKAGELFHKSSPVERWAVPERDEIFRLIQTGGDKPTSNYVVFPGNEHLLRIAKKYGLAGAVPTMGALAAQDRYAEQ